MLTLEEAGLCLKAFEILSNLCIFPIHVDVKSGKIQRQSNRVKVLVWKMLFGIAISYWFYVFGRLVQSTVIDREKYFRWDHVVLHFGLNLFGGVFNFNGFSLFVKNPEVNMIIFNQLFEEREDPVQKMMEQSKSTSTSSSKQLQRQRRKESPIKNKRQACVISTSGNKTTPRRKSRAQAWPTLEEKPNEEGQNQNEVTEEESQIAAPPRPLLTWPLQYSLEELLAKLLPLSNLFSGVFTILFLVIDPTRPQLLFSSLPPEEQHASSFLILLPVELLCVGIPLFTSAFALATQILFFGKCQLEFKRMSLQLRNLRDKFQNQTFGARKIEREIWMLRQILKEMRELVVFIELFNRCFPFPIFAWKICSLSISIAQYFFVIRHFHDFPFLAGFLGYIAFVVTLVYTIMYEKAFSIPGKMDELKREFLLTAQKTTEVSNANENQNLWAEMKREIGAIRGVGIKVGGFHQMERQSTPIFFGFVFTNVVNLLVTFPR